MAQIYCLILRKAKVCQTVRPHDINKAMVCQTICPHDILKL